MSEQNNIKKAGISRREFIARASLLGSLAMSCPSAVLAELRQSKKPAAEKWQQQAEWQTLAQVQEILFPATEDAPGASDIGATIYLHQAIENPDADGEDKGFIFRGVGWLNGLTNEHHKKSFLQLSEAEQQATIEVIVKSQAGQNWVSLLLGYTLEALLMAPVYGGNPDGIGWKWLAYQPGFPLPPVDKTWDKLLQQRYKTRERKA